MTSRRAFLGTLAGALLAAPALTQAQRPMKPYQVGVLTPARVDPGSPQIGCPPATALFVMHQPFTWIHRQQIVDLVRSGRLTAVYGTREYVEAGGLLSYGVSPVDVHRRAAVYVDKILKGARPADLPVEQPTKFELVINLKSAKTLGLTMPRSLLVRADHVIE